MISLHNEDCLRGIPERVQPGSIDVVVTSPPYNIGTQYGTYDDTSKRDDYLRWIGGVFDEVVAAMSDDASLFLNIAGKPSDQDVPFEVLSAVRGRGLCLQNTFHWIKSIAIDGVTTGHYKPINSQRFVNDCHEYIFHLTKTGRVPLDRLAVGVPYQDEANVTRWSSGATGVHCRGNAWFIPYKTISSRASDRPHPATFPVELPEMCLRLHGVERIHKVMDPFAGIGSTALACARLGLSFVGFEIDREYHGYATDAVAEMLREGA